MTTNAKPKKTKTKPKDAKPKTPRKTKINRKRAEEVERSAQRGEISGGIF